MLAALDAGEAAHAQVSALLASDQRQLLITDYVLAEVDFLILRRLGPQAETAMLEQVLDGTFARERVADEDLRRALEISARYAEHRLGVTDTTLMALSERLGIHEVLTLDRRHFSVFRDRRGKALRLLP